MIKYTDLYVSVGTTLKDEFGDTDLYYGDQAEDSDSPQIYVNVEPLTIESFRRYNQEQVNITITYIDSAMSEFDKLNTVEKFKYRFDTFLNVNDCDLMISNKKVVKNDAVTINFMLNYKNLKDKRIEFDDDKYTALMEELYVNINFD